MKPQAVFIGMPGAGKSTVGRAVAHTLGVPFADSDSLIVQRTGKSVRDLFANIGEERFRAIEADVIARALKDFGGVLALGGGAVLAERTQKELEGHRVILIDADDDVLADRIAHSHTVRPLLADDPYAGILKLRKERGNIYRRLATDIVHSTSGPASLVAAHVVGILNRPYTPVAVKGSHPYTVHIGYDLCQRIIQELHGAPRVLIVHAPEDSVRNYAQKAATLLSAAGTQVHTYELPRGEAAKDIATVSAMWDAAGEYQIGRDGALVAIGGGATTDVGGFVAATWLRGIKLVTVPTTLLGMVDAAVGGKTGINTAYGKNLVGAFYPPETVVCDMAMLTTLPHEEIRAGLGEVIKCGFIQDREILEIVARHGVQVLETEAEATGQANSDQQTYAALPLQQLVEKSVAVKARVVSEDLKESGLREILNYGHTLAHAIERHENYHRRHGEAVAIGCVFAAALSEALHIAPAGFADLHRSAFAAVGLPISYHNVSRKELLRIMHSDKKVRNGALRFVLLSAIGEPTVATNPPKEALSHAFEAIGL